MAMDIAGYNRSGQAFVGANVSAKSVIAVATGETGLILYNPNGSNKLILLYDAGFVWTTAPGAVHNLGIAIAGPNATLPSALTVAGSGVQAANGLGNAGTAVGKIYDAATLPVAPTPVRWFGGAAYGSAVGESPYKMIDLIDGAIALVPGAVACLCAVTTTAIGMGSFTWVEVPTP